MEGRNLSEVTHLALLGVKIRETAFWDNAKEKNKPEYIRNGEYIRELTKDSLQRIAYKREFTKEKKGKSLFATSFIQFIR